VPNFSVHIMRPDGNSERYNHAGETPREAAKKALEDYEKWVMRKITTADPGREKRFWQSMSVPRLVEVWGSDHRIVAKFGAKDV
jgi:hypothetical protein